MVGIIVFYMKRPVKDEAKDDPADTVGDSHQAEEKAARSTIEASQNGAICGERESSEDANVEQEVGGQKDQEGDFCCS